MTEKTNNSLEIALLCAKSAIEKKAENVRILDLHEVSSFTDFFIICSGNSSRQLQTIAQTIEADLKLQGRRLISDEGQSEGRWILLDFGDVVVHLFLDSLRDYYDLEGFWSVAPRIKIPSELFGPSASFLPILSESVSPGLGVKRASKQIKSAHS